MAEITSITPQKHDAARCNIEVDGRFYCGLKLETVMSHRLKVGAHVSLEELARIQLESEKSGALDKALLHIAASMKTEKEVRDYLKKKGYLEDVSDYVIEKMKGYGFLDDAQYAKAYTESAAKRKSKKLIALELRRRGVDDESVRDALSDVNEEETAVRTLEKYVRGKDVSDPDTFRKAYRYLISKGFDYEVARTALARIRED